MIKIKGGGRMFKDVTLSPDQNRATKLQLRKTAESLAGMVEEPEFYGLSDEEIQILREAIKALETRI
jgi:hypothetical protein